MQQLFSTFLEPTCLPKCDAGSLCIYKRIYDVQTICKRCDLHVARHGAAHRIPYRLRIGPFSIGREPPFSWPIEIGPILSLYQIGCAGQYTYDVCIRMGKQYARPRSRGAWQFRTGIFCKPQRARQHSAGIPSVRVVRNP